MTTGAVFVAYLTVLVAKVVSLIWAATQLPDRVASHFGSSGAADGWMGRREFLIFDTAITVVLMVGLPWLGTGFLVVSGAFVVAVLTWALLVGPRRYAVPDGHRPRP